MRQRITLQFTALLMLFMSLPLAAKMSGLPDFTELVEKAGPAVVNIRVTQFGTRVPQASGRNGEQRGERGENHPEIPEFFRRYFNVPNDPRGRQPDRSGAGSGFIYEADGYILTNHHVIEDADEIIVRLADRREFEAELIGSDESSDIAVLKIDAEEDLPGDLTELIHWFKNGLSIKRRSISFRLPAANSRRLASLPSHVIHTGQPRSLSTLFILQTWPACPSLTLPSVSTIKPQ